MGDEKVFSTANIVHQFVVVTLQSKPCSERNLAHPAVGCLPVGQLQFSLLTLGVCQGCWLGSWTGAEGMNHCHLLVWDSCRVSYGLTQVLTAKFTYSMNPKVALPEAGVFQELSFFPD